MGKGLAGLTRFLRRNKTKIITGINVIGIVGVFGWTIYEAEKGNDISLKELAKKYWKQGTLTLGTAASVIFNETLNEKDKNALLLASNMANYAYNRLTKKRDEKLTSENPSPFEEEKERAKFYIPFLSPEGENDGIVFEATKEEVLTAEKELNRHLDIDGYVTFNDFLRLLGLLDFTYEHPWGDQTGWSKWHVGGLDGKGGIEFNHLHLRTEDGDLFWVIDFNDVPRTDFLLL